MQGKRIIITRSREQSREFLEPLAKLGAEVISFPTIEIASPDSWVPLDAAIRQLRQYQWLIFTSANGVRNFSERLASSQHSLEELQHLQIATIGPATAKAIRALGLAVHVLPEVYKAEGLVESLRSDIQPGTRVLLARAKVARDVLPEELKKMGAEVTVVEAYQTVIPTTSRSHFFQILHEKSVDLIVFTSSSTVTNLAEIVQPSALLEVLQDIPVACIGPITSDTVRQFGLDVSVSPPRYDIPSLVQAITAFFARNASKF